jgi:hypothetical protein
MERLHSCTIAVTSRQLVKRLLVIMAVTTGLCDHAVRVRDAAALLPKRGVSMMEEVVAMGLGVVVGIIVGLFFVEVLFEGNGIRVGLILYFL